MTSPAPHILVCDDENDVREHLARQVPAAILLDINMPGEDGLSLLKSLRNGSHDVPVIMLTAAGEVVDRIIGLELGADDYLGKPVDLRELEARIKAVLRRKMPAEPEKYQTKKLYRFGKAWLDIESARLVAENGEEIPITSMEFNLLKRFALNPGRVLNRDQILEGAHDRPWDPFDRSIDIRISRLRRKIELNGAKPVVIQQYAALAISTTKIKGGRQKPDIRQRHP